MNNIWSNNKYVNITICILLFLLGINFMHYGQLLLPIICLIIFIDNKLHFKVNNKITFVVLCLFAVSFFAFSYEQGFYCVMGFCLPMAYYIGSNIKEVYEDNIKKVIYLVAFGMICHVLLNFGYEIVRNGMHLFYSSSHYDIWSLDKVSATAIVINTVPLISFIYYLFFYEKNKTIKWLFIICLTICIIYNIGLGQRTMYLMIALSIVVSYFADTIILKNKKINKKILFTIIAIIILIAGIFAFFYISNVDFRNRINSIRIFAKFSYYGFSTNRITILLDTIKLMPYHLWGGNEISSILGIMPHDLLLDVYDYAGIITVLLLIIQIIIFVIAFIKIIRDNDISKKNKTLIISLFICIAAQCALEPVMSGASLFLIIVILFEALVERININENK